MRAESPAARKRLLPRLVALAALWACGAALLPAAAAAADWPRGLFLLHATPNPLGDPVRDVAEAPDGAVVLVLGTFPDSSLRRVTRDGQVSTLARFQDNVAGVGAEPDGGVLVVTGSRVVRVLASGTVVALAGTGRAGFNGDEGPALSTWIHAGVMGPAGVLRADDGSVVFTDGRNNRVRRIRPGGVMATIAGSGTAWNPFGPPGCMPPTLGESPATASTLCQPSDLLPTADGGLVVSDWGNSRVRRIAPDGMIATIAGTRRLGAPAGLAQLADGDIAVATNGRIDRLTSDGTWHPLLRDLFGIEDFAGRSVTQPGVPTGIAIAATREGGLLIAAGNVYYLAPRRSRWMLVGIRDVHVTDRSVTATIDASRAARATLEVRRRGRTIARSTRTVRAGRVRLLAAGRFAARPARVRVTLRASDGRTGRDQVSLDAGG